MIKKLLFCVLLLPGIVSAKSSYDYKTGNSYNTTEQYDGSTKVRGHNYKTGSTWETTVEKDGDMKGRDSDGNNWKYDNDSGSYHNYGTGETHHKKQKSYFDNE